MSERRPSRMPGEFELIARYFDRGPTRRAVLGIGDDAALLAPLPGEERVVATDMLVAGRHFLADVDPETLGHKALAVNLSDLAAMGANPEAFTLAIALPEVDPDWLEAFSRGLFALADEADCELVGGDTTRGPLTLSITVIGRVPAGSALRRDSAQPGDDVWVSGELGAAAGVVKLRASGATPGDPMASRLDRPVPRIALGLALRHLARGVIDVSDGLLADLGHIGERSRVALAVNADRIPVDAALSSCLPDEALRLALTGGDDYELAFTAPPENRVAIEALSQRLGLPLTRIGLVEAGTGVRVEDTRGRPVAFGEAGGFDHFREAG